ncbi:MAG: RidA family protein [Planctomycetes bacterium]|nr:RidA family protein [Planctomycetota bacterium]
MSMSQRLKDLGLALPPVPKPVGSYVPSVRVGALVFTSGQLPLRDGALIATGKVGGAVSPDDAALAARQAALNALAVAADAAGGLDRIRRIIRVNVFVASADGFTGQARVANGASDLLVALFGDAGRHTRCALGAAELPLDAPVELDMIVEVAQGA